MIFFLAFGYSAAGIFFSKVLELRLFGQNSYKSHCQMVWTLHTATDRGHGIYFMIKNYYFVCLPNPSNPYPI